MVLFTYKCEEHARAKIRQELRMPRDDNLATQTINVTRPP